MEAKVNFNQEPISISKFTMEMILEQEKPIDILALYSFYYYTAKWQGVNSCKATTKYAAKGLKIGEKRIKKAKSILIKIGLVKSIIRKDSHGKIIGHYVLVNIPFTKEQLHKGQNEPDGLKTRGAKNDPMEEDPTNTIRSNKEIQKKKKSNYINKRTRTIPPRKLKTIKESKQQEDLQFLKLAKSLSRTIRLQKNITHPLTQLRKWVVEIKRIHTINKVPIERIKKALDWYRDNSGAEYTPIIESGRSLRDKFQKLENAMSRVQFKPQQKRKPPAHMYFEEGDRKSNKKIIKM